MPPDTRQAVAMWTWVNHLRSNVPAPREPLMLNLDETAVAYYHGDQRGNLVAWKRARHDGPEPVQRVSRRQLRGCITHIAIIADRPDVQPVLPQVLLGNESMLLARVVRALAGSLPPNVVLRRAKSSWTNIPTMIWVLQEVGRALAPWAATHQPILLMDCARQHLHHSVARAAARAGIWLAYVPAGLTWLLQPCDTHVFLRYKRHLRLGYARARAEAADGLVSTEAWLRLIADTIRSVLQGHAWRGAFSDNGLDGTQLALSSYVRKELALVEQLTAPSTEPDEDLLRAVVPRGAAVALGPLLRPLRAARVLAVQDVPSPASEEDAPQPGVWVGRLRSSSASASLPPPPPAPVEHPPPLPPPATPPPSPAPRRPRAWPLPTPLSPSSPVAAMARPHLPRPPQGEPAASSWEGPISRRTRSRTFGTSSEPSGTRGSA